MSAPRSGDEDGPRITPRPLVAFLVGLVLHVASTLVAAFLLGESGVLLRSPIVGLAVLLVFFTSTKIERRTHKRGTFMKNLRYFTQQSIVAFFLGGLVGMVLVLPGVSHYTVEYFSSP